MAGYQRVKKHHHRMGGGAPERALWPMQHHTPGVGGMERKTLGSGMFEVNRRLRDMNDGADGFTITEINPTSGAVQGLRPGNGGLNATTEFLLDPSSGKAWIPSETYFRISARIYRNTPSPVPGLTDLVPYDYAMNTGDSLAFAQWAWAAMFQQCRITVNGAEVESNLDPIHSVVSMSLSGADRNWLNTAGSSEIGAPLFDYAQRAADATSGQYVSWTFRMPLSFMENSDPIRNAQIRLLWTWSPQAEQACVDSADPLLAGVPGYQSWVAGATYTYLPGPPPTGVRGFIVQLNEFVMGAAIASPSHNIPLAMSQKIDLQPTLMTPTNIAQGATTASFNIAIPPSTYKVHIFFQSNQHGAQSQIPIDLFDDAFLTSLRISDQSGFIAPIPDYNIDFTVGPGSVGVQRPYYDWTAVNTQQNYCAGALANDEWEYSYPQYAFRYILPPGSVKNQLQVTVRFGTGWPVERGQLTMYLLAFHTASVGMEWNGDGTMKPLLISRDS